MKRIISIALMIMCCCYMMAQQTDKEYHIKTSDGVTLYAHVRGIGAPCLYLHGGPGAGSTWMKEMGGEELEKRYTMVYLDQRGFCKSTVPADDNFSLSRQTLDFEEVRKALGIERWFILGHSFGGILEIGYWRDYPNSICGMIFEDCTLSMNECFKESWLPAALEIVGDKAEPVAKDTTAALPARMAAIQKSLNDDTRALIFTDSAHKQVIDTLNSWTFHKECICHTDGGKVMMIEDYWTDFRPLAQTVTVPVLFFVGNKDRAIGPDSYKNVHFPNAIIRIGNCGHFPFLESPEEWANALNDYSKLCSESLSELESEYVTIKDSIRVHYKIWNRQTEAKTICFVHGFGCDMNTWEKQFEAFRNDKNLRMVFIDLPGYGLSDKPHVEYTLDFYAHAIDEVLNANNIHDAVFVGHSLGTPVCRQTLMTTGHQGALVDVDGVYCFYDGTETPEYVEAVNQFGHAFDGNNCSEVITGFVSSLAGKETPQEINDYAMSVMPKTPQYVASSTMRNLIEKKWWNNRQISLPVMVICTQNSGLDPDNKQKMQRLYPTLDYTELTTCGHFIHMEQPKMFNDKTKTFIAAQMSSKQVGDAQILFEIRPEVNYVTHLYTLAGLGFYDEEYATKYGGTLPKAAVDTLQKYKDYLTFGQGEGGMLAGTFFFMVSAEIFANANSLQKVMDKYQEMAKNYNSPADIMNIANAIAKVYVDNYDNYLKTVYPQAKKDMEKRQNQLSQHMRNNSFVKDWERVTGYTWHRGDYHWLLYRAGAKGPSYNNLNENTNTVYYNQSLEYQLSMFSHEFGIFLMQDSIMPIFEEMKEYTRSLNTEKDLTYVPWSAFESLACWYNCKIAGKETEDYRNFDEADVKTFCQIFDRLSATGITIPADLYRKGIMEYLKLK